MPNTINLHLLENRQIKVDMRGIPLGNENSYRIYQGEENATQFTIASKPTEYENADYYVIFINSQNKRAFLDDIIPEPIPEGGQLLTSNTFTLPKGMAVKGYGFISIYAMDGAKKVPFQTIKVKIWETIDTWKDYVKDLETIASQEWVEKYVDTAMASIDLSSYYTKEQVEDALAEKQNVITATNKLSSDLIDDTNKTHKFVTNAEKSTWNGKQNALVYDTQPTANSSNMVRSGGIYSAINTAVSNALSSVYKVKGTQNVFYLNNLTKSATMNGDVYNLSTSGYLENSSISGISVLAGDNVVFVWNNGLWKWDKLAADIDLSNYYNKTESDNRFYPLKNFSSTELNNGVKGIGYAETTINGNTTGGIVISDNANTSGGETTHYAQILLSTYANDIGNVYFRMRRDSAGSISGSSTDWTGWTKLTTLADLANYVPKNGNTEINGYLNILSGIGTPESITSGKTIKALTLWATSYLLVQGTADINTVNAVVKVLTPYLKVKGGNIEVFDSSDNRKAYITPDGSIQGEYVNSPIVQVPRVQSVGRIVRTKKYAAENDNIDGNGQAITNPLYWTPNSVYTAGEVAKTASSNELGLPSDAPNEVYQLLAIGIRRTGSNTTIDTNTNIGCIHEIAISPSGKVYRRIGSETTWADRQAQTGATWGNWEDLLGGGGSGGTKLYKHTISVMNDMDYFYFTCNIISTNLTPFTVQAGQTAYLDLSTYMTGFYPSMSLSYWEQTNKGEGWVQALLGFEKSYLPSTGAFEFLSLKAITNDGYQDVLTTASSAESTTLRDVVTEL